VIELACLGIVLLWVAMARPRWQDFLGIAGLAWVGEQSCIAWYGFYAYADRWAVMLGDVPAMVVLIWPVVVLSARTALPRGVGPVVLLDAALIEPIAVFAGLWSWTEPGLFDVPLAGVLGWAIFAALLPERIAADRRTAVGALRALVLLHVGLLAAWWGALRWLPVAAHELLMVAAIVAAWSATIVAVVARARGDVRLRRWPTVRELGLRAPGAGFFVALLVVYGPAPWQLWALLAGISGPWLIALAGTRVSTGSGPRP